MSKKKITLSIISIILVTIVCMLIPNQTKAATTNLTTPIWFGPKEFWGNSTDSMAYAIRNPYGSTSATDTISGAIIWQIVKYQGQTNNYDTGNFYCAKSGIGFTDIGNTTVKQEYNRSYNLKNDKNAISSSGNKVLKSIVDNGHYDNLMALLDRIYLKGISTDAEKQELLKAAGINANWYDYALTDTDIQAVQQAAIWYYVNHDTILDEYKGYTGSETLWDKIYNQFGENKTSWLNYSTSKRQSEFARNNWYTNLSDLPPKNFDEDEGWYGQGIDREEQAVLLYNYLIKYANTHTMPSDSRTNVTLYASTTNQYAQPIIEITKTPEVKKEFDLSIRKYVTKLDGVALAQSRVPNITVGTIETEGTATYKHRKDPVTVTSGMKVTYNLTVYNEGEKAGRATKITDQLADGLEFSKIITSGFSVENYDRTNNIVTIKRDSNNTTNLAAFDGTNLKSETIEIECIVKATPDTINQKILTNVAWISEEYDAVDKVTITNQENLDRDSEPSTKPSVNKSNMENYIGDDNNKTDLSDPNYHYKGKQDDDDFEKLVILPVEEGKYNITLIKEDKNGNQLNKETKFNVNNQEVTVQGQLAIATNVAITEANINVADVYTITETKAPDKYCKFNGTIKVTVTKKKSDGKYEIDEVKSEVTENGEIVTNSNIVSVDFDGTANITIKVKNYQFDLALIKKIDEVNGTKVPERIENVDITKLVAGTATTADYQLNENPVPVKKGDIVKYTLRVYNEGDIDGYASEITEDIPEGLEFMWSDKTGNELTNDTSLTQQEKDAIKYNQLIWDINIDNNKVRTISTNYLAKGEGEEATKEGANLIKAFDSTKGYINTINNKNPDYKEVSVYMRVISEDKTNTVIRNEAAITEDTDSNGNDVEDRDSSTGEWKEHPNHEDDEDHDYIILQSADLALRKFIIAVSDDTTISEDEYLKNGDGTYSRAPEVDTSKLNTVGENNEIITTATYNHSKEPVTVELGDTVVYMLRVYNEGSIKAYASEITDYLPPYLEYIDNEFNKNYGWSVSDNGRIVKTNYLENHIIDKTTINDKGEIVLSYKEVPIMCKIKDNARGKVTNIAEITECRDESKNIISDRDSEVDNVNLPSDGDLPNYKDNIQGNYIPGQQDDDDFEKVVVEVKIFDLALRKFITGVNDNTVTNRVPEVKYENGKINYEHTKNPVQVATGNTVIYTIRVYNEGEVNGYASKVSDDIPNGLEFLPENDLNKEYRWVMYDSEGKETKDVSKAVKITTDYLSKEQGETRKTQDSEENPALLHAFDSTKEISETNPDYADVKVAFKVKEPNTSDMVIINSAQITDDTDENGNPIEDDDSTPDEWIEGEDDQDKEYIKLTSFDLALRKFITQVENEKVTNRIPEVKYENGKIAYEHSKNPIDVVTGNTVIYTIRVYNEGDINGYASKVSDDIPDGLEFLPENDLNKEYRWIMYDSEGNETEDVSKAVKITTDYLSKEQGEKRKTEDSEENPALLHAFDSTKEISETNPDYADVKVAFKVKEANTSDRIIINSAQITDDTDEEGNPIEDNDSTPDEWIEGEDDQDKEYIKLTYFDLALRKWVTHAIVIENGKETVTPTGHNPEDDPEDVVKVELDRKKINEVTVKFKYSIRVKNEGDIAGYAKEITDYVPQGLKFIAADNPDWIDEGNNVISTRKLENTLLQPGESADVQVTLTWINGNNNLGTKVNIAEISEDYNDKHVPDIDSTPDNKKDGEDDIDDAPVLLSVATGRAKIYLGLGVVILIILAGGVVLIKKYVI
ncbi:MAG: Cys-Gln thioester bond-forming surface protein [Clostridia bacterium]|nr:Cys-Gln thioester bond-forming surface protein [Clostridia bacterium]